MLGCEVVHDFVRWVKLDAVVLAEIQSPDRSPDRQGEQKEIHRAVEEHRPCPFANFLQHHFPLLMIPTAPDEFLNGFLQRFFRWRRRFRFFFLVQRFEERTNCCPSLFEASLELRFRNYGIRFFKEPFEQ